MLGTSEMDFDQCRSASTPHVAVGADSESVVSLPRWRQGEELPPFELPSMVAILNGILDGTTAVQPIQLTCGVAVQLYHLVFKVRPQELRVRTWPDFYAVLGTLSTGGCRTEVCDQRIYGEE